MEIVMGPDSICEKQFERMVANYQAALLRMCYMYLQDRTLAEDAVQETYLKAYKSLPSFRGDCQEKTWLVRIAVNTCRDMQRSAWFRHTDRRVTPEELNEVCEAPRQEACEITLEIMKLPRKLREVVLLYYYQNMTTEEIGGILGCSRAAVSHRLKQAREKLHDVLTGGEADD